MKVALYLRVSSTEQAQGHSLEGQYHELRGYSDRMQYRVVRVFRDAESGQTFNRRSFHMLMMAAQRGEFEKVILWKRDRFGRDLLNGVIERELNHHGVKLETVAGPQPETKETKVMNHWMDGFAWLQAQVTAENCMMGKMTKARQGGCPFGKLPFGYDRDRDGNVVVLPDEANMVKEAARRLALGESSNVVGGILGVQPQTIRKWMRNPAYRGILKFKEIVVPGALPRILDDDTVTDAVANLRLRAPGNQGRHDGRHVDARQARHAPE